MPVRGPVRGIYAADPAGVKCYEMVGILIRTPYYMLMLYVCHAMTV
jgi:hypothetical protein